MKRTGSFRGISWDPRSLLKFRAPVLLAFSAVTVLLGFQLGNLRMADNPLESMYPAGHAFLPALRAISRMSPEPRMLICILECRNGDIYNPETIEKIHAVTKDLMGIDGVLPGEIASLTLGMDHYNHTAEGLSIEPVLGKAWPATKKDFEELERRVAVNPMGPGRYVAYDGTAAMITASLIDVEQRAKDDHDKLPDPEKAEIPLREFQRQRQDAFLKSILEGVRELERKHEGANHGLHFMGPQLIQAQMTRMGARQFPIAAAAMFAIVAVFLAVRFRTVRGVFFPLFAMAFPMLWCMGLLAASGMKFNPMALTFPLVLGIFGLVCGVLVLHGYQRAWGVTGDRETAIRLAFRNTPIAESILAAGLATMTLYAIDVPILKAQALLGAFWLAGAAASILLAGPALLSLLRPLEPVKPDPQARPQPSSPPVCWLSRGKARRSMLVLCLAVLAAGGYCAAKLRIGDNLPGSSYLRPAHPWNQCFDLLSRKFMGPYQLLVYARAKQEGGFLDPEAVRALGDFSRYLRDRGGARDSIAFDMMIRMARLMLVDGNPKWQTLPESREHLKGLAELVIEQGGVESFMDASFTEATISPFFPEKDAEKIDEYASRMQTYIDTHPSDRIEFSLGGGLLGMTKAINDATRLAYPRSLALAFLLVFLLGTLSARSVFLGLVVTLPLAVSQALLWIILAATGMKLSMPVVLVSATAIGFGPLFGFSMLRSVAIPSGPRIVPENPAEGCPPSPTGVLPFLGILAFCALLPWFFTGMKFQSTMVLLAGITLLLEALFSILLIPALAGTAGAEVSPEEPSTLPAGSERRAKP